MIMPSPTVIVARRIYEATARGHAILLKGGTMGGGPSKRALTQHIKAGLAAYATIEAALTFHDNLDAVKEMGVTLLAPGDMPSKTGLEVIGMRDLNLEAIRQSLDAFSSTSGSMPSPWPSSTTALPQLCPTECSGSNTSSG